MPSYVACGFAVSFSLHKMQKMNIDQLIMVTYFIMIEIPL